jgi:hypothetical protein
VSLEIAELDTSAIADAVEKYGAESNEASHQADKKLYVEFRKEFAGLPNQVKSAELGRPVFDEVEYIRIERPGDRLNVVDQPVNDFHRARFRVQYEHWQRTQQNISVVSGTPIEKWPEITRGDVEGLRSIGIRTVELLCNADDNVLGKYPGLREMQRRAKGWLDVATKTAAASQLRAEKEKAEADKAALKLQLEEQAKRLAQLEEALLRKGK